MTYYSDLPLTWTEVCSVGGVVGQPAHYAIISCPRSCTMATGSHSAVLIAASHSHTFTDHTNQTRQSEGFHQDKNYEYALAK